MPVLRKRKLFWPLAEWIYQTVLEPNSAEGFVCLFFVFEHFVLNSKTVSTVQFEDLETNGEKTCTIK